MFTMMMILLSPKKKKQKKWRHANAECTTLTMYLVHSLYHLSEALWKLRHITFDVVAAKDELTWTGEAESIPEGGPERLAN